jgi:hypothetical protein
MVELSSGAQAFVRKFSKYGGALRYSELDPLSSTRFAELIEWYRSALNNAKYAEWPYLPTGQLEAGFVHNQSFNAIATANGKQELIGVFAGAISVIYEHFQGFLADPQVLTSIGDSAAERGTPSSFQTQSSHSAIRVTHLDYPVDPVRLRAALHLALNAALFLFIHELTHVSRGHLVLLKTDFARADYTEIPFEPLPVEEAEVRRALELDADEGAATGSFTIWKALYTNGAFPALEPLGLEESWTISVVMLFRIMTSMRKPSPNPSTASHPSPDTRLIHILYGATDAHSSFPASIQLDTVMRGVDSVKEWWLRTGLSSGHVDASQDAHAELRPLRDILALNSGRLRKYAHERSVRILSERIGEGQQTNNV